MNIFKEQARVYSLTDYQIYAFEDYGEFLATVGQEHYHKVVKEIIDVLHKYNLSSDGHLVKNIKKIKIGKDLRKALAFRETLLDLSDAFPRDLMFQNEPISNKETRYQNFVQSLDLYINDLKTCNVSVSEIVPSKKFVEYVKKTKTPIKECIRAIIVKYELYGNVKNFKKLIDKLNDTPQ